MVRIVKGSFRSTASRLPGSTRAAAARAATVDQPYGPPQLASNILIVSGSASATGTPLFVGGPQIGFNYPGLTLEMRPPRARRSTCEGATSAPFPGYMLIGRGPDYAWTLTSADADIIDTYAETLCGGSKGEVRLQGQVPHDGDGRRGHDLQGRQERQGDLPRARSTARCIGYAKARGTKQAGRAVDRGAPATAARRSTSSSTSR